MSSKKKPKPEISIAIVEKKFRKTYGGGPSTWPDHLAFLVMAAKVLEKDNDELHGTLGRLTELLKGVAIALKGPEPELTMWDWSDLPELAEKKMKLIRKLQGQIRALSDR